MKTFEQFRAWMKDNQAWNEYLSELNSNLTLDITPEVLYAFSGEEILNESFDWRKTRAGRVYWRDLHEKWIKFYNNNMKQYEFVYVSERVACVKMPKDATAIQIGFVKDSLQKECQEITGFEWEGNLLYGLKRKMGLKKL